jgi:YkoY family integral membrane protein
MASLGWLKIIGGLYLLRLAYTHFTPKVDSLEEGFNKDSDSIGARIYKFLLSKIGIFWSTVILVEIMDMVFSVDNIFAAVAMTDKFWVIFTGVAIGIITMRFVAMKFVKLMEKYPDLEKSAYIVIALLGLKLVLSGSFDYFPNTAMAKLLASHYTDMVFSIITLTIFFLPLLKRRKKSA